MKSISSFAESAELYHECIWPVETQFYLLGTKGLVLEHRHLHMARPLNAPITSSAPRPEKAAVCPWPGKKFRWTHRERWWLCPPDSGSPGTRPHSDWQGRPRGSHPGGRALGSPAPLLTSLDPLQAPQPPCASVLTCKAVHQQDLPEAQGGCEVWGDNIREAPRSVPGSVSLLLWVHAFEEMELSLVYNWWTTS